MANRDLDKKIYKKTGNSTRLEVLPYGMGIGRIRINFQAFEGDPPKQTALVGFYLSLTQAYALGYNIICGNAENIPKIIGGTPQKNCFTESGETVVVPAQYREMIIYKGMKKPWILQLKACEGEVGGKTGGIMPKKGLKKEDWTQITIAFESSFEFDEFGAALMCDLFRDKSEKMKTRQ